MSEWRIVQLRRQSYRLNAHGNALIGQDEQDDSGFIEFFIQMIGILDLVVVNT